MSLHTRKSQFGQIGTNSPFSRALYVVSRSPRCCGSKASASAEEMEKKGASNVAALSWKKCALLKGS